MMIKSFAPFGLVIIGACIVILGCNKEFDAKPMLPQKLSAKYDTINSLDQMHADTVIWRVNGQCNMVTRENSTDEEFETDSFVDDLQDRTSGCSNNFAGVARASAKKSFATASYVTYPNIASLRSSLPTDTYMLGKHLTLSSPRITEEKRNVSITNAYLYAISRESDNDYHMIIGDGTATPTTLMNCECGGLPATSATSYHTMKTARDYIKSYFGTDFCGTSGYTHFAHPIHITVLKGSLFYDIDHSPGTIGPTGFRANTSWEMHPISTITF
ncbi:MAG: hypothetical protein ACXVPU_03650 [Bacteroidia bacterium]